MTLELDAYGFPRTSGIFETIKTVQGKPIALGRHMRRALQSATELGIPMPSEEVIRLEILKVLEENPFDLGRLRICIYREGFLITHNEYQENANPARLTFYSQTVLGMQHKLFPYDFRFSLLEIAKAEGFDDCLLFNAQNFITESAVSNLLFRIDDEWITPPITSGILPGIIRALAIEECGVSVRPIHVSEVPAFESGFLISSLRIAQPISHIGEMKLEIGAASREMEAQIRACAQPVSVG
jgi:branched-chain amino acid aminotransferase